MLIIIAFDCAHRPCVFFHPLDYNYLVHKRTLLLAVLPFLLSGCGLGGALPGAHTSTPFIITSTLAPTVVPSITPTPIPPTPSPTFVPVQGMPSTQVYVRDKPSSAATQLGMLGPATPVQIIARDADTTWYEILYPQGADGRAWVSAQFIVVSKGKDTIPEIGGGSNSTSPVGTPGTGTPAAGPNGTVIQQVNVRNGPGTTFDAIGTLNPNDTVTVIGKDPSGDWLQIAYPAAPDGKGWVASSFVQGANIDNVPVVGSSGAVIGTGTPVSASPVLTPTPAAARDDHDSAQAPAADVTLSSTGTRSFIFSSDLSSPTGDRQDWIQFTSSSPVVLVSLSCTGNSGLALQLTQGGSAVNGWTAPTCGQRQQVSLFTGKPYLVALSVAGNDNSQDYVHYDLRLEVMP